ncbi:acetyl-CoA carboxylase biotin carboxylase subunit [Methylocapsa acidiphila]|uniref:acetyl-CoA carboxylase biotin carboxylase subunit n=1 Tax=Methylocapsa acidiphila TaxID=133552 RepID=UPI000401E782|nr:acetyl/propionyl/methylcrotonyl-CoA carboxylase subunit alpha [Methylocapsa acidiphila]
MFKKLLIANRGEIACRVIRTARRMGIATVAVYSEADKHAQHVALADEALPIGPAPAAHSYLAIEKILEACKQSGAEAVHPGYGFLSERADFAQALCDMGVAFVGPHPRAIEAMGDKIASKKLARAANVSTVPGFVGAIEDEAHARAIAEEIGYPVMIKASAGGGGKGMRIAHSGDEITDCLARAASEAKASFGDERLLIEKFIADPRHIEIQVLGDKYGGLIHLGERECSIQRRHQKVVEEAPSPFVDEAMRREMGEQAIALAAAVNYDSAGTVEFVVAQDKSFYFLEMNTRLQVEHPVTELVTGVDLVEEMIKVAAGAPLSISQRDVHLRGAAIESRIYAEDPARNFLPSVGRLTTYRPPAQGHEDGITLRLDGGVLEGDEISIHYDPMVAKLVTHAGDRAAAIDAQARALDQFAIEGVGHNIPFLAALMAHPRFKAGDLSTAFIAREYPGGFAPLAPEGEAAHLFVVVAAAMDHLLNERKRLISGQMRASVPVAFERDRSVILGKTRHDVKLEEADDGLQIRFEATGHLHQCASDWAPGRPIWTGVVDGEEVGFRIRSLLNGWSLAHGPYAAQAYVYTRREAELAALMPDKRPADRTKLLLCPMPGLIKAINVSAGQQVKAGETLCVVEAMKMENALQAAQDGTVKKIFAREGESLAVDAAIMEFT